MSFFDTLKKLTFRPHIDQVNVRKNKEKSGSWVQDRHSLEAAVVVPAMREGVNVLDTLLSAALQKVEHKNVKDVCILHGIVLVLNKPTNSGEKEEENRESNLETLKLLEYIKTGIMPEGANDKWLTKEARHKVMKIRETGVPIYLIDASSPGRNTQEMNVALARHIGTEFAFKHLLKPGKDVFVLGTDADTRVAELILWRTKKLIEEGYDAGTFNMNIDLNNLSQEELEAGLVSQLHRSSCSLLTNMLGWYDNQSLWPVKFTSSMLWFLGGGMFMNRAAYDTSGGYDVTRNYSEDMAIVQNMAADQSIKLATNLHKHKHWKDFTFKTSGRASDRTIKGVGTIRMEGLSHGAVVPDILMISFDSLIFFSKVTRKISELFENEDADYENFSKWLETEFPELGEKSKKRIVELTKEYAGIPNNNGHQTLFWFLRTIQKEEFAKTKIATFNTETNEFLKNAWDTTQQSTEFNFSLHNPEDTFNKLSSEFLAKVDGFSATIRELLNLSLSNIKIKLFHDAIFIRLDMLEFLNRYKKYTEANLRFSESEIFKQLVDMFGQYEDSNLQITLWKLSYNALCELKRNMVEHMTKNEIMLIDSMILYSRQRYGQEMKVYKEVQKKIEGKVTACQKVPALKQLLETWKYILGVKTI